MQSLGLAVDYKVLNSPTRLYCKLLACLAFLPLEIVVETFDELKVEALKAVPGLAELYKYFEANFIGQKTRGRGARKDPR